MTKTLILMATFNGEKYLGIQLDSIAKQTRKPDEIIFRDDKSTDGTVKKLREFSRKNPEIKMQIFINRKNVGFRENFRRLMNDARKCSDADFVFFGDQDDFWYPEKIAKMAKILEDKSKINLLGSNFNVVKLRENVVLDPEDLEHLGIEVNGKPANERTFNDGKVRKVDWKDRWNTDYTNGMADAARKSWLDEMSRFYRGKAVAHDKILAAFAATDHSYYIFDEILTDWNRTGNNVSMGKPRKNWDWSAPEWLANYYSREIIIYKNLAKYAKYLMKNEDKK